MNLNDIDQMLEKHYNKNRKIDEDEYFAIYDDIENLEQDLSNLEVNKKKGNN